MCRALYRRPYLPQTHKRGFRTKRDAELYLARIEVDEGRELGCSALLVTLAYCGLRWGELWGLAFKTRTSVGPGSPFGKLHHGHGLPAHRSVAVALNHAALGSSGSKIISDWLE
jgi:hypothetical protein